MDWQIVHSSAGLEDHQPYGRTIAMTKTNSTIIYTHTDEAPALATYSFLPIIKAFTQTCGIARRDPRHLTCWPDHCGISRKTDRQTAHVGCVGGVRRTV